MKLQARPYQLDAINWLKTNRRGILTDVPGLGKTLQASEAATRPVMVICPTYLVGQWEEFLVEQYPEDKVVACTGTKAERLKLLATKADWHIINIEMLRTFPMPVVKTIIIDEAHRVKGHNSIQAIAAQRYAEGATYVYLLTATPTKREVDDWYMLLRIVAPRVFTSYWAFVDTHCNVKHEEFRDRIQGAKYPKLFERMLRKYTLGRTYANVGIQVPPLIETTVPIRPGKEFYKIYNKLRKQYTLEDIQIESPMEVYSLLRQMTMSFEKLDAVTQLVEDNGPAVIFCWYRNSAQLIGEHLGIPIITGEMNADERRKVAKAAQASIAVTIASLSEGIDLTQYRNIIFAEEDYTPGSTYQAVCRVRRPSDNLDPVRVYYPIVLGTIDSVVRRAVQVRKSSIREIIKEALR